MERWRWLPRDLGARHLLVNVPGFTLDLVEGGRVTARHRVIVGRTQTPTPQFGAEVTGVILNPWWDVPASIVAESVGALIRRNPDGARARGYVWQSDAAGHLRVRQAPGPANSLGLMKLVMPNPFSIFVHDTPAKPLFARPVRALSHGCIRTENPLDLAAMLTGLNRDEIDARIAPGETARLPAPPLPIYIVYLTATAEDGTGIRLLPDIYRRDELVAAQLADRGAPPD
ncbi:L,D-transpeptidase family protein [Sphingomonas changnyeongensis]|uniref:L,D-transpeptidase family protein n=1 Tax=Sphingomonas changnyeongensis TaxID=2698679 RepID=A0A7Z2NW24_9SPHN|nr:L,D-transpeptidase family protein [Sphingomonas changnyeongensis]QHL90459.1 L,D-transpeptidase family protein [Sphingomonas changnyeongensis]